MGFSNPAQPVDYTLIGQLVDASQIDYNLVRASCDLALQSTDNAIALLASQGSVNAVAAQLTAVSTALSSVSAILSGVQTRPEVPGWSEARTDALTQLLAVQAGLDAVNAQLARDPDASPEAAGVVSDLEDQAAALWPDVKP